MGGCGGPCDEVDDVRGEASVIGVRGRTGLPECEGESSDNSDMLVDSGAM